MTKMNIVVMVLVLIAIIVSAGTLFYVTDVMDRVNTLTDSTAELTST